VDPIRVSTDSEPGKAGQARLTDRKNKLQTQIDSKRSQLDKQRAAIEAKLHSYTPQQREAKAKEFQKRVEDYQKLLQKADKELQELQQEQSRLLYERIEQASAEYGKANGLAVVIIKRDLLYQAEGVDGQDITEGIVKLVNGQDKNK
jgi:outer membrane protein